MNARLGARSSDSTLTTACRAGPASTPRHSSRRGRRRRGRRRRRATVIARVVVAHGRHDDGQQGQCQGGQAATPVVGGSPRWLVGHRPPCVAEVAAAPRRRRHRPRSGRPSVHSAIWAGSGPVSRVWAAQIGSCRRWPAIESTRCHCADAVLGCLTGGSRSSTSDRQRGGCSTVKNGTASASLPTGCFAIAVGKPPVVSS